MEIIFWFVYILSGIGTAVGVLGRLYSLEKNVMIKRTIILLLFCIPFWPIFIFANSFNSGVFSGMYYMLNFIRWISRTNNKENK